MTMDYKLNVTLNKDKDGYYVYCPELPGCHTQGDTIDEALENIKEAASLYLETMTTQEINEALNGESLTTFINLKVA